MTKKITLEDLATMVAEGFNELKSQFSEDLSSVTQEVRQFKKETEDNFERIDLRPQQVAYQSDYRELDQRVTTLERKVGVR